MLIEKISVPSKKVTDKQYLISELQQREVDVLLTVGAGDIDQLVEPIAKFLESNV